MLERRTPLKRASQPMKRGQPLARESEKAKRRRPVRRATVEEVVRTTGNYCHAAELVPEVKCWGPLDPDEWKLRSAGGSTLDASNVQMICRAHHDWKHREPIVAAERGLRPFPVGYMPDLIPYDKRAEP